MNILVLGDGLLGSEIINQTKWDYMSRKKDGIQASLFNEWKNDLSEYDVILKLF